MASSKKAPNNKKFEQAIFDFYKNEQNFTKQDGSILKLMLKLWLNTKIYCSCSEFHMQTCPPIIMHLFPMLSPVMIEVPANIKLLVNNTTVITHIMVYIVHASLSDRRATFAFFDKNGKHISFGYTPLDYVSDNAIIDISINLIRNIICGALSVRQNQNGTIGAFITTEPISP